MPDRAGRIAGVAADRAGPCRTVPDRAGSCRTVGSGRFAVRRRLGARACSAPALRRQRRPGRELLVGSGLLQTALER
ncbi:MAG TPA: hypothetical protein VMW75_05820, partial [Thermoanaerobaculia bacterium]|nr:hypothetical protein [Thermoanaerobaculia bacterium]